MLLFAQPRKHSPHFPLWPPPILPGLYPYVTLSARPSQTTSDKTGPQSLDISYHFTYFILLQVLFILSHIIYLFSCLSHCQNGSSTKQGPSFIVLCQPGVGTVWQAAGAWLLVD